MSTSPAVSVVYEKSAAAAVWKRVVREKLRAAVDQADADEVKARRAMGEENFIVDRVNSNLVAAIEQGTASCQQVPRGLCNVRVFVLLGAWRLLLCGSAKNGCL